MIALFNFGDSEETAWIDEHEKYNDMLTKKPAEAKNVCLPAYGFKWLVTKIK